MHQGSGHPLPPRGFGLTIDFSIIFSNSWGGGEGRGGEEKRGGEEGRGREGRRGEGRGGGLSVTSPCHTL